MRLGLLLSAAVLAAALGSAASAAAPLGASTLLNDFNAVVFTNGSTAHEIEGAAVIGGTFSGAVLYSRPTTGQPAGFGALTVFGATSGGDIDINNSGDAYVAGAHGAKISFNGGGYIGAPSAAISDFVTPLSALSTSLSKLSATGSLPAPGNNEVIKAVPGANGIAVFDVSASDLAHIPSYGLQLNGASTVIFNVSGATVDFDANDETGTTGADNIIWNFYQATSVDLQTDIAGTVLAPLAHVANGGQIDGVLVADAWTGDGELHDWAFTGPLPPSVPEPGVWAMLLVGLAALGAALRGRRSPCAA